MAAIAEELVERAIHGDRSRSSYAEFRSRGGPSQTVANSHDAAFWKYLVATPVGSTDPGFARMDAAKVLFEESELRVLSKATSGAGGYAVPADFDQQITSARRARNVIGELARNIETDHGRVIPLGTATAHGTGAWTAENAAVTASDETFGQVSLGAFKGMTKTIVSEELAQDALDNFDEFLADELGQRLALLEETAFAVGDGTGKPLGIAARLFRNHGRDRRDGLSDRFHVGGRSSGLGRTSRRVQDERILGYVTLGSRVTREPRRHRRRPRPP